jgi:hypothetical protein
MSRIGHEFVDPDRADRVAVEAWAREEPEEEDEDEEEEEGDDEDDGNSDGYSE